MVLLERRQTTMGGSLPEWNGARELWEIGPFYETHGVRT
jgi:hypothetical protein